MRGKPSEPRKYVSKKQAARKLDNQFNGYHVKKSPHAAQNRPGDIPPPCLVGPEVDFLTREEIDDRKKKLLPLVIFLAEHYLAE